MKRDIHVHLWLPPSIYYIMTEFHYTKRGSAYGGVMYKTVWGKTLIDILAGILIFL